MSGTFIAPTIGRIVHFYPDAESGPRPAIVTQVWSEKFVNLAIFKADGNVQQNPPTSIPLIQGDAIRPAACWCEWMPWQVEKAAEQEQKAAEPVAAVAVPNDTPEAGGPAAV